MAEKPLMIETEPPAAWIAGSPQEHATVSTRTVVDAADHAARAWRAADALQPTTDTERALQGMVKELADCISGLAGEVSQLTRAIRVGRIAHSNDE